MAYGFLSRWSETSRSSIVRTRRLTRRVFGRADIEHGWPVVDVNGLDIGTVKGRMADFLAVSRGLFRSPLYVPLTAVRQVTEGRVRLNLSSVLIDERRWTVKPRAV